jgi:TetR/AcrR family transcriptional regulator, fatty acid metabolism regulator protein
MKDASGKSGAKQGTLPQIRDRILDVALDVFSRKGYRDTHLDEIAAKADTSEGSIFFHFASKEQIFLALIDQFADLLERRVTEAIQGQEEGMARVRTAVEVCLETFGRYRWPAKILLIQAVGLGAVFEAKRSEIHERFAGLIEIYLKEAVALGQIEPVDTEVTAHAWMGAIYNLVIRWLQTGEPEQERIVRTLPPMLLRSIGYEAEE